MSENAVIRYPVSLPAGQVVFNNSYNAAPIGTTTVPVGTGIGVVDRRETLPFPEASIRQQLARILESSLFVRSEKLSLFLRFIVEYAVAGKQVSLKEYLIGCEVYDRKPPYHPSHDSIVRSEARRLRSKLKDYYETYGKNDSIGVELRPGNYRPVFQSRGSLVGVPDVPEFRSCCELSKPANAVLVFPFLDISGSPLSSKWARGVSDELAFTLFRKYGCRVTSSPGPDLSEREQGAAAAMARAGARIAFAGSVREEKNQVRVIARILDQAGFHLWTNRFDVDAAADTTFALEEQIVAVLSSAYDSLFAPS